MNAAITPRPGMRCFSVRHEDEWACICVEGWERPRNDGSACYVGEVLIHSSFGSYAHQWGAMGVPVEQFLAQIECGYAATKFLGAKASVFSESRTRANILDHLRRYRRQGRLTLQQARVFWGSIQADHFPDEEAAVRSMREAAENAGIESHSLTLVDEPWDVLRNEPNPAFSRFWDTLWRPFVAHLQASTTAAA